MDQEARMSQLYDKMAAEQAKYRGWLLEQSPEEIVSHAYEYAMREDVLMAMEDAELRPEQAEVLLASVSPLDDVYQVFSKMETPYMDTIRECIETRADALLLAQRETPLYRQARQLCAGAWGAGAVPGIPQGQHCLQGGHRGSHPGEF